MTKSKHPSRQKTADDAASGNKAPTIGHACFHCGLMFANKLHFDDHMKGFHDIKKRSLFMNCRECGKGFTAFEDLAAHELDHDIIRLVLALKDHIRPGITTQRESLLSRNVSSHPSSASLSSIVPASPGNVPSSRPSSSTRKRRRESSPAHSVLSDVSSSTKRSRRASPAVAKVSGTGAAASPLPTNTVNKASASNIVKKPQTGSNASAGSRNPVAKSKLVTSQQDATVETFDRRIRKPSLRAIASTREEPKVVSPIKEPKKSHKKLPSSHPPSSSAATARVPPVKPAIAAVPPPKSIAEPLTRVLGSGCPFCSMKFAKPWELVTHMTDNHEVLLVRIVKRVSTQRSDDTKTYSKPACPFCSEICMETAACLRHVLSVHRNSLFCSVTEPDAECLISLEMLLPAAQLVPGRAVEQKFTVSVKVTKGKAKK